ncbi:MAG: glycosyltransferase [Herpetosiphonaceae bacterium]|nr:glycosyltransferase [Herpetosiphonaceae bacterium]
MLDNEFPPLGGGTGVINYHLLRELAAYPDIWIDLITSSRSRTGYTTEQFAPRIMIYKVPVDNHNIHHATNHELVRYAWRGLKLCHRLMKQQQYDLSFAFAGVPAGAISFALKLRWRLPYLVSLQGPDVPGFEARYQSIYPLLRPLLWFIWHRAAAVTASSLQHQQLAQRMAPRLAIPIVPNGVDTDLFYPADHCSEVLTFVCVGRLIERKGQQHLLQAFAQLQAQLPARPMRLDLIGTGDAEAGFKQQAAKLGLGSSVRFRGCIDRAEMPYVYREADVFVLPSQNEGMSIALLEAMASGLPVVVTDTGGTDELVMAGTNGLVTEWADVGGLCVAMRRLAEDTALRQQMSQANRAVGLTMAWKEMAKKYLTVLELSGVAPTFMLPVSL